METHKRTVLRSITYRISALLLTIPILYYLTGSWENSVGGSILTHILLSVDYYIHERIWLKIKWGLK
jgi:uncharacterized membrane protein